MRGLTCVSSEPGTGIKCLPIQPASISQLICSSRHSVPPLHGSPLRSVGVTPINCSCTPPRLAPSHSAEAAQVTHLVHPTALATSLPSTEVPSTVPRAPCRSRRPSCCLGSLTGSPMAPKAGRWHDLSSQPSAHLETSQPRVGRLRFTPATSSRRTTTLNRRRGT